MPDLNYIPTLSDDVRFRIIGDEVIIICQEAGEIMALNASGGLILQAVDGRQSVREIIDAVQSNYALPVGQLQRDILEFLSEMLDAGVFKS